MQTPNKIIVHYGEIGLKGKNQPNFRKKLQENIRTHLKSLGLDWKVTETRGYLSVQISESFQSDLTPIINGIKQVAGIVWFAPVIEFEYDPTNSKAILDQLEATVIELAKDRYRTGQSFCIRVKRINKRFPLTSNELEIRLGDSIIQNTGWNKVNLTAPDRTFFINIRTDKIFLYSEKIKGMGGLPVGTVGKVLALLSGGIDSPVAAYLAARRGCRVDFLHFTATLFQQQEAEQYKVSRIVQKLSQYTKYSTLYLLPYIHFDMAMFNQNVDYELVLFRRFMARTAQKLAQQTGAQAIVTGDNLAQVASQTLPNIVSTSKAVTMPLLRPLLTYDKQEIVDMAKSIDTYTLSIEPYKDCCAIISRHPKTKSDSTVLTELEQKIFNDYDKVIDDTLADLVTLKYKCGEKE